MADKAISELMPVTDILPQDSLVVEQNGTAMRLPGQVLLNWLVRLADGHGGIQNIRKTKTEGFVDTYTITYADSDFTTEFTVTNGKGVQSFAKTKTQGLVDTYEMVFNDGSKATIPVTNGKAITSVDLTKTVGLEDTYTIQFNDGSSEAFTIRNGEKGDPGDNAYFHIKWASQEPTPGSHSFGNVPDKWVGVYADHDPEDSEDYTKYQWYEWKGAQGDTGDPAKIISQEIVYQVSDSGTIYPSGAWSQSVPVVPAGKFLWTRTTVAFNSGTPVVSYSVGRMGIDGSGAVSTVNNVSPDSSGNVSLTAENVGSMPASGGDFTGPVNMNGQKLTGLNPPTDPTDAASMAYVDGKTITTDKTLTQEGAAADAKAAGDEIKAHGVYVGPTEPEVKYPLWVNPNGVPTNVLLDLFYPVGSVYISSVNASPANRLGGTWERIKDRMLIGAGDQFSAGTVGGNSEILLTIENMPNRVAYDRDAYQQSAFGWATTENASGYFLGVVGTDYQTGNIPHDNMPPYKTYYMWERTA